MERCSAEDALMLWPERWWPQEIGALVLLDGAVDVAAVRAVVESRLAAVPRFRQLLVRPRWGLGGPFWADSQDIDMNYHIRVQTLPDGATEVDLLAAVERIRSRRLSFEHPLWELWLVPGLTGGRTALFVRMHHAIADGVAGVATISAFIDELDIDPGPVWSPAPAPTASDLFVDNLRRRAARLGRGLAALAHPLAITRRAWRMWAGLRATFAAVPTVPSSLDAVVGSDRAFGLVRADLDDVRRIARVNGVKINDVLLCALGGGVRAVLQSRGEGVDGVSLPIFVPHTLRSTTLRAGSQGNLITQMIVPVPLGPADPWQRLREIGAASAVEKTRPHAALGSVLGGALSRLIMLRVIDRHRVSVTTADLVGPQQTVGIAGARVVEVFPLLPLISRVTVAAAALSYAGGFAMTVVVDPRAVPDLAVLTQGIRAELRTLGSPR